MQSEMIERVAKAIRDSEYGTGSTHPWEDFIDDARAAIEAMRVPTQEMLDGAATIGHDASPGEEWEPMIDAALTPSTPA